MFERSVYKWGIKKLVCCWKQNKCTNVSQTFIFAVKWSYFGRKHLTHHQDNKNTVDHRLSGLIGTGSHPEMQTIRIIGFLFENRLHWLFEVRLLLFTACTCVWTLRSRLIWSSMSHNTVLYLIRWSVEFSTKLPEGLSRYGQLAIRTTSVRISGVLLYPLKIKCSWKF
jgi:hypothetical protein